MKAKRPSNYDIMRDRMECEFAKYDQTEMIRKFDERIAGKGFGWSLKELLPKVLKAGEGAGTLTEEGARLLDPDGNLAAGIPLCPPEGDAGTGMAATNTVAQRTGNVSAGTSIFSMVVLERPLQKVHPQIDLVTTPDGSLVAMVHANNCTSDLNAWVHLFREFAESFGVKADMNELYGTLYRKALEGEPDCGGLLAYGYLSGENITEVSDIQQVFETEVYRELTIASILRRQRCAEQCSYFGICNGGCNSSCLVEDNLTVPNPENCEIFQGCYGYVCAKLDGLRCATALNTKNRVVLGMLHKSMPSVV